MENITNWNINHVQHNHVQYQTIFDRKDKIISLRMGWNNIEKEHKKIRKFMKIKGIEKSTMWTQNQLVEFVTVRTEYMMKKEKKPIKAYKFVSLRDTLETIFKCECYSSGDKLNNYPKFKSTIKKTINQISDKYYKNNLVRVKHASTFSIRTIVRIAKELSEGDWKEILTAIALLMSHYTGARMKEISDLWWEDWIIKRNKIGTFWVWLVRTSKSNKIPVRREQLTYLKHPEKRLFESLFINYWKASGKPKSGKIFPEPWFTTHNINYQLKKISKCHKIDPPISAHSGRNWAAQQLVLKRTDLVTVNLYMRWATNSQMIFRYRNNAVEETKAGGAYALQCPKSDEEEFEF